jgi:hypothetical protein
VHRSADGNIYDGEYVDGNMHGHGKLTSVRANVPNNCESKTESWSAHAPAVAFVLSNGGLRQGSVFETAIFSALHESWLARSPSQHLDVVCFSDCAFTSASLNHHPLARY